MGLTKNKLLMDEVTLLICQNSQHRINSFIFNDLLQHIDGTICHLAPFFGYCMIGHTHIRLACDFTFHLRFFHLPFTLKQCPNMPFAVFKIFFLNHIPLSLCCIIGIIALTVMDMKYCVTLSGREQNITAIVDRQMTTMFKLFAQKNQPFFQKHLWRGYALGMYRCFYQFLDLFQCKHFVHLSAFRLRVN